MKRRTFLYHASMGTLGFSFFSGFPFRFDQPFFSTSIESFFQAIGAQAQSSYASDPKLEEACKKASASWKKTGYEPLDNQYFFCNKGQKAVFLLHLPHQETGSLDISALVFQNDPLKEAWHVTGSLSGFQLEALIKAAAALKANYAPNELSDLLLPSTRLAKQKPGRFITESGEVAITAILAKDKSIRVKATVYEAAHALWSSEYTSQYLQSFQP